MPCTGRAPQLYSTVLGPACRPAGVGCLSPGEDKGRSSQWSRGAPAAPRVPVLPPSMGLTWKQRVFTALLGAAAVSGLTALLLYPSYFVTDILGNLFLQSSLIKNMLYLKLTKADKSENKIKLIVP